MFIYSHLIEDSVITHLLGHSQMSTEGKGWVRANQELRTPSEFSMWVAGYPVLAAIIRYHRGCISRQLDQKQSS